MVDASISRQFARWAANLKYEDLSPAIVDKVKAFVMHALAGGVLGLKKARARNTVKHTLQEEGKTDGATIFADGGRVTRMGAAYANAELIRESQLVDSYRMLTHPGSVLVPVAMAHAEMEGRSGMDLITGLAAGYEFMLRLCDEFIPATAARGFRPSPIYGTMGGALAGGKLMGLNEDGLVATIALAANFASGLAKAPRSGGNDASIHEPHAARSGVLAAWIASQGHIKGTELALEGRAGFYNAFIGNDRGELSYSFTEGVTHTNMHAITKNLDLEWQLPTVMFRMYASPGYNQPVIDLIAQMKQQHQLNVDDIRDVSVKMNWLEIFMPSPAFPRSTDPNEASLSTTHFYAAHAAVNGGYPVVGGATYGPTGDKLKEDQRVIEFMKAHVHLVPEKNRPMFSPAVVITLKSGRQFEDEYPYQRMEWNFEQLAAQLQRCVPGYPGGESALRRLVETTSRADQLSSVAPLLEATLEQPVTKMA